MDDKRWRDVSQTVTVRAADLVTSLENLRFAASEATDSSLSGVMVIVQEDGHLELVATDGAIVATARVDTHGPSGGIEQAVHAVPADLAGMLRETFSLEGDRALCLGWRQGEHGPQLLVADPEEPGTTVLQDLWDPDAHIEIYNATVASHATTTSARFSRKEVAAALTEAASRSPLTLAATPGGLRMATPSGPLKSPVAAQVEGPPVRIEVPCDVFEEALRGAAAFESGGNDFIAQFSTPSTTLQVQASDGSHGQAVYVRTGSTGVDRSVAYPGSNGRRPAAAEVITGLPDQDPRAILAELHALPGLHAVKEHADLIVKQAAVNQRLQEQGMKGSVIAGHLAFAGASGTGKSLAATHLARLYKSLGLLEYDEVTEVNRVSLLDHFISGGQGRTAKELIADSMGGMLVIDGAFSLVKDKDNDMIKAVIEEVLRAVETRRGQFVCVVSGTKDEMDQFLASNINLRTNFSKRLDFTEFTADDLTKIARQMIIDNESVLSDAGERALRTRLADHERRTGFTSRDWANARSVANLVDSAIAFRNVRIASGNIPEDLDELLTIEPADVEQAADALMIGRVSGASESLELILAELNALTGQNQLKAKVHSILSSVRVAQAREQQGLSGQIVIDHMLFVGPPGTGKTTIARLIARLYCALGILPKSDVVEVDHGDLKGEYEGHTAQKVDAQIDRAMGGVLLIDEAYQLVGTDGKDKFGQEAVTTLLKRMEDDKNKFLVIATGYPDELRTFVRSNPGLPRRFGLEDDNDIFAGASIRFTSYDATELLEIARVVAARSHNVLTESAAALLGERLEAAQKAGLFERAAWGNGGSIRNLVEAAFQARDVRVAAEGNFTKESLTTLTEEDVAAACDRGVLKAGGQDQDSLERVLAEIEGLTGQARLKREIQALRDQVRLVQTREAQGLPTDVKRLVQNMIFTGPPGTGKTTAARLVARLYKALGLLSYGGLVEVTRNDLVGAHVGETAIKTTAKFNEALGGVLFIDEAYSLASGGGNDFGKEAIDTLVALMESNRGRVLVIAAGYTGDMVAFVKANPGMASRLDRTIEFEPYSAVELSRIAESLATTMHLTLQPAAKALLDKCLAVAERAGQFEAKDWGNARVMRQLVERAQSELSTRVMASPEVAAQTAPELLTTLMESDVAAALDDRGLGGAKSKGDELQDVLAELDALVGQPQLKQKVREILATAETARELAERGVESAGFVLDHLLFVGPPGTGKTTVARILARLYGALGLLSKGHLVEVDRSGLVEGYVGQTASKTNGVVDQALGGVLFIDEAYALIQGGANDFGGEALTTLLKRMSDDTGQFIAIAAGYPRDMREFVASNPGLSRRFSHTIEFVPYTAGELLAIAQSAAARSRQSIDEPALAHLSARLHEAEVTGVFESAAWGNAGSVINVVKAAIQVRDSRLFQQPATTAELTTLAEADIRAACDRVGLPAVGRVAVAPPAHEEQDQAGGVEEVLAQLDRQPIRPQTKQWIRSLAGRALGTPPADRGKALAFFWKFEGHPNDDMRSVAGLLARLYQFIGVTTSDNLVLLDLAEGADEAHIADSFARASGGAVLVSGLEALTDRTLANQVRTHLLSHGATSLAFIGAETATLNAFLQEDSALRSRVRWSVFFDGRRKAPPNAATPMNAQAASDIASLVGEVASLLAPEAAPGRAVASGPELSALGVTQVYWQRARSGGGGGMGIQLRTVAGSKDFFYYFAGGSNGSLPALFEACGEAVPKAEVRDLRGLVAPARFTDWRTRPEAARELAEQILAAISSDRTEQEASI